ncbi:hypothetical protein [Neisseria sicca]|nr:hypothetical protein [Neisseria sicca]MBF1285190.1 hypothetical protein [Neisseria sp.]
MRTLCPTSESRFFPSFCYRAEEKTSLSVMSKRSSENMETDFQTTSLH